MMFAWPRPLPTSPLTISLSITPSITRCLHHSATSSTTTSMSSVRPPPISPPRRRSPKWLAIQKPLPTALLVVQPLAWFHRASYPFIWLLNQASLWLLRLFGVEPAEGGEQAHSEEELRLLLATVAETFGRQRPRARHRLERAGSPARVVRDVMRPRQEITFLDTEASITECLDIAEKTRYSRFPLCEGGDLDKTLGVVHFKDLFAMRLKARRGAELARWLGS